MEIELRTRDGRCLGLLRLAAGVSLAELGRALLDGVVAPVPAGHATRPPHELVSTAGKAPEPAAARRAPPR